MTVAPRCAFVPLAPLDWAPWIVPLLAFAGALAPTLLALGRVKRRAAQLGVLAALVGLLAYAIVAVFAPAGPDASRARAGAVLDAALGGALVALAALGVSRIYATLTFVVASFAGARGVALAVSLTQEQIAAWSGVFFWLSAALLAASLAGLRFKARPRATRS